MMVAEWARARSSKTRTRHPDDERTGKKTRNGSRTERQQQRQQQRPSTWSHCHIHRRVSLSKPVGHLSRSPLREEEQGTYELGEKIREGKVVAFDDPVINSCSGDDKGHPEVLLRAEVPQVLRLTGLSSVHQRYPPQQAIKIQSPEREGTKSGVERCVEPNPGNPPLFASNKKVASCAEESSQPLLNAPRPTPRSNPATLLDNPQISQLRYPHGEGLGRRKIMRTVSQDDYLLARGANPRTGMVTPSVHSASGSMNDTESSQIYGMNQPAKWRLKGDQWVSLSLNEPSPLPSPPPVAAESHRGRALRIPPKLARGRPPQHPDTDLVPKFQPTGQHRLFSDQDMVRPSQARPSPDPQQKNANTVAIRRKPLGAAPSQGSVDKLSPTKGVREASTETVITKRGPDEQGRSSSMPTPQKFRFFKPEDVGKELPPLPSLEIAGKRDDNVGSASQDMSFLGIRPGSWLEDVPSWASQNYCASEPSPPCPPTKDIPSHSRRLMKPHAPDPPSMDGPPKLPKLESRQELRGIRANTDRKGMIISQARPEIPPRRYKLDQAMHQHGIGKDRVVRRSPESHLNMLQPKVQTHPIDTTGQMTMAKTKRGPANDMTPSPSTTTPTTIPTITTPTLPEDTLVSSSWREVPSPVRQAGQRQNTALRPQMPERAEGTRSVPRVSPPQKLSEQHQWRMTGTSESEISTITAHVKGSPERNLIPRPLRPSKENGAPSRKLIADASHGAAEGHQAGKMSSHCKATSSDVRPLNTHGFTHTQGSLLVENIDPRIPRESMSSRSQQDSDDHFECCPECCEIGCHGSCLGHMSPGGTTNGITFNGSFGTMKQAVRNSIRLSRRVRIRRSAGGSHETEAEEVTELETPMPQDAMAEPVMGQPWEMQFGGHDRNSSRGQCAVSHASGGCGNTSGFLTLSRVAAVFEAADGPFAALRVWAKRHPQLPQFVRSVLTKMLDMSKHVVETMFRAYQVASVYSETGNLDPGRETSLVGFLGDCARAVVYALILTSAGMIAGRILLLFTAMIRWLLWSLSWVAWIVRAVGCGLS